MSVVLEQIKQQLENLNTDTTYSEGVITRFGDGIAIAEGLKGVGYSEIVKVYDGEDDNCVLGLVFNLESDHTGIILLEEDHALKTGARVVSTGEIFNIEVSEGLLGRNINILGEAIDGLGDISHKDSKKQLVEKKAYGVIERKSVTVPLQTGIIAVDALIPIGRGQRELIIGDRQTGKTALALDIIINQGRLNQRIDAGELNAKKVYSIYVAIGQKKSKIAHLVTKLKELNVLQYTVIVTASASDTASSQYLAPYVGTAIGEFFMERGEDALIIYDDLSKQAKAYRQISLLMRRPPGREAYPGDVFYLHSRLLERAARLSDDMKGGSLTALPIIETQAGDVSAYIPTNVISITDGQIYLTAELFNAGIKPAVNVGISVSRVGGNAQIKAMKQVAGPLKLNLAQFRELQAFAQFGVEVDASTQKKIDSGFQLTEVLKQNLYSGLPVEKQVALLWAVTKGYTDSIPVENVTEFGNKYLDFLTDFYSDLLAKIIVEQKLTEEIEETLKDVTKDFLAEYASKAAV
jgi:F-type H+/Na+-transporting ATPase subunit alpha